MLVIYYDICFRSRILITHKTVEEDPNKFSAFVFCCVVVVLSFSNPRLQQCRAGSSGPSAWLNEGATASTASDPILSGSRKNSSLIEEEFRQCRLGSAQGQLSMPSIPGAWYWQHEVPGYRGMPEPVPMPLADQHHYHLSWEAGLQFCTTS